MMSLKGHTFKVVRIAASRPPLIVPLCDFRLKKTQESWTHLTDCLRDWRPSGVVAIVG